MGQGPARRPRTRVDIGLGTSRYAALTRPTLTDGFAADALSPLESAQHVEIDQAVHAAPQHVLGLDGGNAVGGATYLCQSAIA